MCNIWYSITNTAFVSAGTKCKKISNIMINLQAFGPKGKYDIEIGMWKTLGINDLWMNLMSREDLKPPFPMILTTGPTTH